MVLSLCKHLTWHSQPSGKLGLQNETAKHSQLSLLPALWRKEGFCIGAVNSDCDGLEEEETHHGTGLSHQHLT